MENFPDKTICDYQRREVVNSTLTLKQNENGWHERHNEELYGICKGRFIIVLLFVASAAQSWNFSKASKNNPVEPRIPHIPPNPPSSWTCALQAAFSLEQSP